MAKEVDYLECENCGSPVYVFEIDKKGGIASAFCQVCGNEEPAEFSAEGDEDDE